MHTAITTSPIDPAAVLARVGTPADGAALLFLGTVREQNLGRPVRGMRYEAYTAMAERVLAEIAAETAAACGSDRIAVEHRVGELAIGEVSVAIAVSTPHRAAAFDACRQVIETIKVRLPVWKHEHHTDGDATWVPGHVPTAGAAPARDRARGDG
jgi:molybdopterin synthase catalytic subunit